MHSDEVTSEVADVSCDQDSQYVGSQETLSAGTGTSQSWLTDRLHFNDTLVWCEDCVKRVKDPCRKHGPLTRVKDRKIPSRAKLTAPHHVGIKLLEYRTGTQHVYGVFAHKIIQKRTRFGPYEGVLTDQWTYDGEDRIKLMLFFKDSPARYLDCIDQSMCNWLMFIRPANCSEEQNLVIQQYKGSIYYTTTKAIAQNEELRAWYAKDYAAQMGAPLLMSLTEMVLNVPSRSTSPIENGIDFFEDADNVQHLEKLTEATLSDLDKSDINAAAVLQSLKQEPIEADFNKSVKKHKVKGKVMHDKLPKQHGSEGVGSLRRSKRKRIKKKWQQPSDNDSQVEDHSSDGDADMMPASDKDHPEGNQELVCTDCSLSFLSSEDLEAHSCSKASVDKSELKNEDTAAKERVDKKKTSIGRRTKHKQKGRPVKCLKVAKKRGRPRLIGRKEMLVCEICSKAFPTVTKLKIHSYMHSGERPHGCSHPDCKKAFTTRFKLLRHELIHNSNNQYRCRYCEKSFARKDHLKNHVKIHDPNKTLFECEQCGKQYASPLAYKTHLAFHKMQAGELTCAVCLQEFETREMLRSHLKVHAGARSVKEGSQKTKKCPQCERLFFTNKDVQRHRVVHTKTREFMCHLCPQRFGRRDHLVRHIKKTHDKESLLDVLASGQQTTPTTPGSSEVSDHLLQTAERYLSDTADSHMKRPLAKSKSKKEKLAAVKEQQPYHSAEAAVPVALEIDLQEFKAAAPSQQEIPRRAAPVPQQLMHVLPSAADPPVTQVPLQALSHLLCAPLNELHIPVQIEQPIANNLTTQPTFQLTEQHQLISTHQLQQLQQQQQPSQTTQKETATHGMILEPVNSGQRARMDQLLASVGKIMNSDTAMSVAQGMPAAAATAAVAAATAGSMQPILQSAQIIQQHVHQQAQQQQQQQQLPLGSFDGGHLMELSTLVQNTSALQPGMLRLPSVSHNSLPASHPLPSMLQAAKSVPNIIRRSHSMQSQKPEIIRFSPSMARTMSIAGNTQSTPVVSMVSGPPATVLMSYSDAMKLLVPNEEQDFTKP